MLGADLKKARPLFAAAAQKVYDAWDEEDVDTYGGGGICHLIADAIVGVAYELGVSEGTTVSAQIGEVHVWAVVQVADGVYSIDIPWYVYERGGGYSWTKEQDVTFSEDDVRIVRESSNPYDFKDYRED
jgi:hypothetical protein